MFFVALPSPVKEIQRKTIETIFYKFIYVENLTKLLCQSINLEGGLITLSKY